jgi:hypothetical protein
MNYEPNALLKKGSLYYTNKRGLRRKAHIDMHIAITDVSNDAYTFSYNGARYNTKQKNVDFYGRKNVT